MTGPDPNREIYPNAPLKLVTFELRFDPIEISATATERFVDALADRLPIVGPPPHQQLVFGPGGAAASSTGARVFDTARRRAAGFGPQAISFETSAYTRFEEMRDSIGHVLEAVAGVGVSVAPKRVGLRYIDEIDEDVLPERGAWQRYIEPALSSALDHFDPAPREHQSAALFEGAGGDQVVLRYGLLRQPAVDPTGPLVIDAPPRGAYYLIDIDSSWSGETEADPLPEWTLEKLAELHGPVRRLFESSITDELRNEVLRKRRQ